MRTTTEKTMSTLWVAAAGVWVVAVVAWPVLALVQSLTGVKEGGLFAGGPWTLMDTGFIVFLVAVPLASALTVLAWLFGAVVGHERTKARLILGWAGLLLAVAVTVVVAIFVAQLVAFFIVTPLLTALFGLA